MKSISLGQYYASGSILHKLDPRTKVLLGMLYIVCTFLCKNIIAFGLLFLSGILLIAIAKIPFKIILRSLRPIIFIMLFTVVINVFWTTGDRLLFSWSFINIYAEGLYNALFMAIRIIMLITGTSLFLTYTTTPIQLTDAIERLLAPLKRIKVPVHEFSMMMTIALRFVPTLIDETERIMSAQKARGADFSNGSLVKRAKALIPILVPLFVSAFRRADELATAMECRCYHGGEGRTKMTVTRMQGSDITALFAMIVFGTVIVLINYYAAKYGIGYTM
ncbi:MAG: energy-coupling factor transporter transmembrane protein EcfT [Clostridia bacterium]|nr:energy-coupling factor transporter transmembrane protein EcfT [Clostridia bacterium]